MLHVGCCLKFQGAVTMSGSDQSVGPGPSNAELQQKLSILEKRLDHIDCQGAKSPGVLHERVTKLEDQLAQFEVKLGECSGSASGVKEALVSQTSQTNRIEEKLSSQLQVAQASIQACCARLAAMDEQLDSAMRTVASLTAEVNLKQATPAHAPSEDIEPVQAQFHDVLLQILGRLSALENPRSVPEAQMRSQDSNQLEVKLQTLTESLERLNSEVLEVTARVEAQAVHVVSCRSRLDALEEPQSEMGPRRS
ncbi:unnamed protein product [Effrenium voratum]|uniref:Uncharacterized protein n=1 Tax=Effrenium voratum TaxID=2562239 RepID=A0AA36JH84_9DINO|nr:unnamed protein product [Effrenium voratum]